MIHCDFETRSALRKHEWLHRKLQKLGVIQDAHVLQYRQEFPAAHLRAIKECRRCARVVRATEWPRDTGGHPLKHCGCRTGCAGKLVGSGKYGISVVELGRADFSRRARIMALPGFRAVKHQAHVVAYRRHARAMADAKRRANRPAPRGPMTRAEFVAHRAKLYNERTERLTDGYIAKRLKKNVPALKGVVLPQSLIDLERVRLMLVRSIRDMEKHDG